MISSQHGAWRWFFSVDPDDAVFFTEPEKMLAQSQVIKDWPDVAVFKHGDLFFKWEKGGSRRFSTALKSRLRPRAKREFGTLQKLSDAGITVIAAVGYGICGTQSVLITRSEENAIPVWSYFCDRYECAELVSEEFLDSWGRFIGYFIARKFYFSDFHAGNLLYNESEKRFILLDVGGTSQKHFGLSEKHWMRMLFRQLKDVSAFMSTGMIGRVLAAAGNAMGREIDMELFSKYCTAFVGEFLPRRLKTFDPSIAVCPRPDGNIWQLECMETAAAPQIIEQIWHNNFILSLYGIPHLQLLAYDHCTIRHEKFRAGVSADDAAWLDRRVQNAGFRPEDFFYCYNNVNMPVAVDKLFREVGSSREK